MLQPMIQSATPVPALACPYPVVAMPEQRQLKPIRRPKVRRLPLHSPESDHRKVGHARRRRRGGVAHLAGVCAEDAVARHYGSLGAALVGRRVVIGGGELDLVLIDGETLVFVEVKRRSQAVLDDPVSPAQWKRLELAAKHYILRHAEKTGTMRCARFDVAIVDADSRISIVRHARTGEQN